MVVMPMQFVSGSSPYITLGASSPIENSRQAVKWSMDKKVGDISPIFENNDVIYVVAIREDIKDNFIPMNSPIIADYIDRLATAKKHGEAQMAAYTGTTLAEIAKSMGQEVITDNQFNLSGYSFLSSSPELSGKVAAAAPGTVVGPLVSGDRIVVFSVADHKAPTMPFVAANYTQEFLNKFSPLQNSFMMLAGKGKVKNHGLNFILSDEELEQQQALQAKQQK
ncbi:MAG: peptidyl-prolyl cis-trans isomerase [Muribaculaceae bacterium]|nr:peptidyl-prolyl cis-trans isomerase [Muribaculaceae bacterium]